MSDIHPTVLKVFDADLHSQYLDILSRLQTFADEVNGPDWEADWDNLEQPRCEIWLDYSARNMQMVDGYNLRSSPLPAFRYHAERELNQKFTFDEIRFVFDTYLECFATLRVTQQQILQRALDLDTYEKAAIAEEYLEASIRMLDTSMDDVFKFVEELAQQARVYGLKPTDQTR